MIGGQGKLDGNQYDRTDAQGRFELRNVPRHSAALFLMGPGVTPRGVDISDRADQDEVRIVLPASCRVQFLPVAGAIDADEVGLADAAGKPLKMTIMTRETIGGMRRWQLARGKSPVVQVDDTASKLVYFKDGKQVREQAVTLIAGQLNEIQP